MGNVLFFSLNNVEPVCSLHQIAGLPFVQGERRLLKFRDGLSLYNPPQFSTSRLAAGIIRILFGEFGKVPAGFDLLEDVLSLFAGFSHGFLIGLGAR